MPTHNPRPDHLRVAIQSILGQSYQDIEIIVSDDASSSLNVREIVEDYRDARIRFFHHAARLGMTRNWDSCVRRAQGEWVAIFHQDDQMFPDNVLNAVRCAERFPEINFQFGRAEQVDEDLRPLPDNHFTLNLPLGVPLDGQALITASASAMKNGVCAPAVFCRTDLYRRLLPFSPRPRFTADLNMWLRMAREGRHFVFREDLGVRHRMHSEQQTSALVQYSYECLLIEFARIFWHLDGPNKKELLRRWSRRLRQRQYRRLWQAYSA